MSATMTIDIDGLRKVIEAVRNAPSVDMGRWASDTRCCGSTGCAIGWFCIANPKDDLHLAPSEYGSRFIRPCFEDYVDFDAVSKRFGLPHSKVVYFFDPGEYPYEVVISSDLSRAAVISRLESFIADAERGAV